MTKQEATRLPRVRRKSIATHEAGHFVMRWYLETPPTGCIVYKKPRMANGEIASGMSYGSNTMMTANTNALISAAGWAANFAITSKASYFAFHFILSDILKHTGKFEDEIKAGQLGDWAQLWMYSFGEPRVFARYLLEAFLIVKKHRGKVVQVRDILLSRGCVTKREAAQLFKQWGEPDSGDIWRGQSKGAKWLFDVINRNQNN